MPSLCAFRPPPALDVAVAQYEHARIAARKLMRGFIVAAVILVVIIFLMPEGVLVGAMRNAIRWGVGFWLGLAILPILTLRLGSTSLRRLPPDAIGPKAIAELKAIVSDAGRSFVGREQPSVLILNDDIPNAMAVNSLLLNVVPACNAIYISKGLL